MNKDIKIHSLQTLTQTSVLHKFLSDSYRCFKCYKNIKFMCKENSLYTTTDNFSFETPTIPHRPTSHAGPYHPTWFRPLPHNTTPCHTIPHHHTESYLISSSHTTPHHPTSSHNTPFQRTPTHTKQHNPTPFYTIPQQPTHLFSIPHHPTPSNTFPHISSHTTHIVQDL